MSTFGEGRFGYGPFGRSRDEPDVALTDVSLVGDPTRTPQPVRIIARGLVIGQPVTVTRTDEHGNVAQVRGSGRVAASTTMQFGDVATPVNTVMRYAVSQGASTATSDPITVPHRRRQVITSLDGSAHIDVWWIANGDPREQVIKQTLYTVQGRPRMVARVAGVMDDEGEMLVHTIGQGTEDLKALIKTGAPFLVRTDGRVDDIPAVEVIRPVTVPRRLHEGFRRMQDGSMVRAREWQIKWVAADDPSPEAVSGLSTVADFNGTWEGRTVADFNNTWAGQKVGDVNAFDWAAEAALR